MPKIVHNALSATKVAKTTKAGRYADGNGLYLHVSDTGGKSWVWRGVIKGRRREFGLGSVRLYTLAEARETAREHAKAAREGRDPRAERDEARRRAVTFSEAARQFWAETIQPAKAEKSARAWQSVIGTYAEPKIGRMAVSEVTPEDVLSVLRPIWLGKPEMARKALSYLRQIFDWSIVNGKRQDANPTASVRAGLPKQNGRKQHFAALPYAELPALMTRLASVQGIGAIALRFIILTAVRSGEARKAVWSEIDLDARAWTIPSEHTKTREQHRVPLSGPAIEILTSARDLPGSLVFPGRKADSALSDMSVSAVLRRLDIPVTVHGFRSTFRDWAEEQTDYAHEVKEAALAHKVASAVERAYRRTDLFDRRRALMDDWAKFCMGAGDG